LNLLVPEATWEVVVTGLGFADAPCTDTAGNFYFSDMRAPAVFKVTPAGEKTTLVQEGVSGLEFGPNGLLYACQGSRDRVISIDPATGAVAEVATDVAPNDLAVTANGWILITETKHQRVTRIDTKGGEKLAVDTGITRPNGIALSPDGGTLAVSDAGGEHVWMFRVREDGTLDAKIPAMSLRLPIDQEGEFRFNEPPPYVAASRGDGMATDRVGRYFVTSALGVQVFDPTGRLCGVLPQPQSKLPLTSCILAGENHDFLYITNGDTVYRRKLSVD
jgi:enterochelin esterase family protein